MNFKDEIKEEMSEMKNNLKKIEEQSLAMSFVKDYKAMARGFFIIWIITFTAFVGLLSYTIYLLNDIEYIETETNESYEMSTENGNNNFIGGDNNGTIENN